MFNSFKGLLTGKGPGRIFLDTGGVEWELETSHHTSTALPAPGARVRVFTHLVHRDDGMRLYGFAGEEERSLFLDLLKVNGIGPRQALRILSGVDVESLVRILEAGDVDSLTRIPGLGLKSAQKIMLALKGKLTLKEKEVAPEENDIAAALADMGFDRKRAEAAVRSISQEMEGQGLSGPELEKEVFRRAIVRLSG